jgi:hypothetical protein
MGKDVDTSLLMPKVHEFWSMLIQQSSGRKWNISVNFLEKKLNLLHLMN